MKIRAKVTGDVIDVTEATANELIAAGIYDLVDEPSTTVEPLTTKDMPPLAKKVKGKTK